MKTIDHGLERERGWVNERLRGRKRDISQASVKEQKGQNDRKAKDSVVV